MAEGDNQARFGQGTVDTVVLGGVAKGNPITKTRLPEAGNVGGRDEKYARATDKDRLPEHQARRDTYPIIVAQ